MLCILNNSFYLCNSYQLRVKIFIIGVFAPTKIGFHSNNVLWERLFYKYAANHHAVAAHVKKAARFFQTASFFILQVYTHQNGSTLK
jgi:hypothetical protein